MSSLNENMISLFIINGKLLNLSDIIVTLVKDILISINVNKYDILKSFYNCDYLFNKKIIFNYDNKQIQGFL